jgi:hypothetical protein
MNEPLMNAIASEALRTISAFHPQELSNTAWAFSKLVYHHAPLL